MIEGIKTIKDRNIFEKILRKFFVNKTSFIELKKRNVEVKFLNFSSSLALVKFPVLLEEPKNYIAFTRNGNNTICAYLKFCEKKGENLFIFNPTKFQIISSARLDNRKRLVCTGENKTIIFITNFISDDMIKKALTRQQKKISKIKEVIKYDNSDTYENLKVFFSNEDISDPRMKYFYSERKPIYVPDIKNKNIKEHKSVMFYKNNIYNNDSYLKERDDIVSEISTPILFDSKIPYGYIQVNNTTPLSRSVIPTVRRLSGLIDEMSVKHKIFSVYNDKLLVSDISKKGLGVVFRDEKYSKFYKKNCYVSLDMILPGKKIASILADARHMEIMKNRIIKVGFEIKDMDNKSLDNYEKFLGSISV